MIRSTLPLLDEPVHVLPAAQVEVADAEVRTVGERERVAEGREQVVLDVVKYPGHLDLVVGFSRITFAFLRS